MRLTDVATAEQMFRIIQSIPSPKAEPFKVWMAKVAAVMMSIDEYERMADPMEAIMDETDRIAKSDPRRFMGEEVYNRIKGSIRHV